MNDLVRPTIKISRMLSILIGQSAVVGPNYYLGLHKFCGLGILAQGIYFLLLCILIRICEALNRVSSQRTANNC